MELEALLRVAVEEVQPLARAKAIEIRFENSDERKVIRGDALRLQQVVGNLLTNAIKFTPRSGRVKVRLEGSGSQARFSISDTGVGITPEFLPHVFERFRQFDSSSKRTHEGLGLGLAIVRRLVELHGGTVLAQSPGLGKGATFTVELPIPAVIEGPETVGLRPSQAADVAVLPNMNGMCVLVVDDRRDAREMVALVLRRCGAEVVVAESVAAALTEIQLAKPDILISDIAMPGEDGYDLISEGKGA